MRSARLGLFFRVTCCLAVSSAALARGLGSFARTTWDARKGIILPSNSTCACVSPDATASVSSFVAMSRNPSAANQARYRARFSSSVASSRPDGPGLCGGISRATKRDSRAAPSSNITCSFSKRSLYFSNTDDTSRESLSPAPFL